MLTELNYNPSDFLEPDTALGSNLIHDQVLVDQLASAFCFDDLGKGRKGIDFFKRLDSLVPPSISFILLHRYTITELKAGGRLVRALQIPFTYADVKRRLPPTNETTKFLTGR